MTAVDWESLAQKEALPERQQLSREDYEQALRSEIDALQKTVATIRQILYVRGLAVTDIYHQMVKDNAFTREETLLAPRVRMDARYGTPSFFWERTVRHAYPLTARQPQKTSRTRTYTAYIPRKGSRQKEKMRVYLLSKHIPVVKKTSSVPDSVFDSEPAWAQTAAHLIEPELTELRKQAKAVSRLSQAVMRASAAFAKNTL